MFKVYYKYSACIKICTEDITILCDPWFGDNAYEGTWTQYPKPVDIKNFIGSFDYIFISHIHPDHYCSETIYQLLDKSEGKKIIIADWGSKPNYLKRKLQSDGLEDYVIETNYKVFNNTQINIVPNITDSLSDVDSAILVTSKISELSVLNINDCIYNPSHFSKINKLIEINKYKVSLFCLSYTGAGPYPQTYYSPYLEKNLLIQKANIKKENFFKRYLKAINEIKSINRLPFAGKYLLRGNLSKLNQYRGVADALEVKKIDKGAIIIDDGGDAYFDLEKNRCSRERKNFYEFPQLENNQANFTWRKLINFYPNKSLLKRILLQSLKRAHVKSECFEDMYYSIYAYDDFNELEKIWKMLKPQDNYQPILTFNCNKNKNFLDLKKDSSIHSHIFIESKALFAVLTGLTHWNNYEIGSVFQVRRVPDIYNCSMQRYLNFLSII